MTPLMAKIREIETRTNLECSIGVNTGTKPCVVLSIEESTLLTSALRLAVEGLEKMAGSKIYNFDSCDSATTMQLSQKTLSAITQLGLGEGGE